MSKPSYTLIEFCVVASVDEQLVIELVEHGILEPESDQDHWLFPTEALARCLRAERLRHDLELDFHGVALALELTDKNQRLRQRIDYLEQLVDRLKN
ncbi:MAG: chaperone modulatory protein CbpM [Candidatus Azotimanducaceae bacterium]|jgi:chaperone modulatory protein CbpM